MIDKLIKILELPDAADEKAVVAAVGQMRGNVAKLEKQAEKDGEQIEKLTGQVAELEKKATAAGKDDERELLIVKKMEITGMSREQAAHVVDQQAKEDAARAKAKKKDGK